eukprot:715177_1
MIWEGEYLELERRFHRAYLNKPTIGKAVLPSAGSLSIQEIKRDTTYKSLKQMSCRTDIDDTDHDAAVYLLKTYFPDDDEDDYTINEYDHYHSLSLLTHRVQKSNLGPTDTNKLKIKP